MNRLWNGVEHWAIIENWNQDHLERNINFGRLYAKDQGSRKSTLHPRGWNNTLCAAEGLKIISNTLNSVLVRVPLNIYYYYYYYYYY